jgi:uncharacterized protein (DUF2164 family)
VKPITFGKDERAAIVKRIQEYAARELDHPLGNIGAEQLLAFFTGEIGAHYYNQGLADAQAAFARALDEVNDAIYALEQRAAKGR